MNPKLAGRVIGFGLLVLIGAAILLGETHRWIAHFRLVSFGLAFLFLSVSTALAPARVRSAGLVLASIALGVTVIEAAAVWKEPRFGLSDIYEYSIGLPVIGWDNGGAGATHVRKVDPQSGAVIYDIVVTTGANHERLTKSRETGRSVVFFGDSFTYGDGVDDADTMPQKFADLLGGRQKVVNLGVNGFSPSHVLAELQTGLKDKAIGDHPVAFVMLTGSLHVVRTSCKESWTIHGPRYEMVDGRLRFVGACAEGAVAEFRRFLENTAAYRVFVKPLRMRVRRDDVETYIEIVAEVARTAKVKYGVEIIVPYVGGPVTSPRSLQLRQMKLMPMWVDLEGSGYDDAKIIAALKARGVKVVDMTLRDEIMKGQPVSIPGDGHPTPFAHARRAEMTLAALRAAGITLSQSEPLRDSQTAAGRR